MPQPLLRSLFHQLADRRSGDNLFGAASTMKPFCFPISPKPCSLSRISDSLSSSLPPKLFHALHSQFILLVRQTGACAGNGKRCPVKTGIVPTIEFKLCLSSSPQGSNITAGGLKSRPSQETWCVWSGCKPTERHSLSQRHCMSVTVASPLGF